ncbi:hypothetical protein [Photobacterium indicum]|uniref:hypothetical protein n=1 Tax=Photobacterium indicum TaxID=81447 RepID=UPI003D12D204
MEMIQSISDFIPFGISVSLGLTGIICAFLPNWFKSNKAAQWVLATLTLVCGLGYLPAFMTILTKNFA